MTLRILFAFVGGRGHFDPLVPIAGAARMAGHAVAFTCSRSMVGAVEAAGFELVDDPGGVARVLDPVRATATDILAAVREVLADPATVAAVEAARDTMLAIRSPRAAVAAIERLATSR